MRAKVKSVRRKASILHGATAGYVSLVDRGANETPFKMVKSAEGAGAMGIKKRKIVETKSHKKLATGKKQETAPVTKTVMAKMVFDQDHFETEQDVLDWIEKAEWDAEGISVTDDGDGHFVARPGDTTDDSFSRIAKVDTETEGVEAYVGTMLVKSDDEDDEDEDDEDDDDDDADDASTETKTDAEDEDAGEDEDDEDGEAAAPAKEAKQENAPAKLSKRAEFIAKARSTVAKFSGWDAYYSKKSTLVDALKAGMEWDATPPGFYDVQAAFNGVVQSILGDETEGVNKAESLAKAAADYADLLTGMDTFFDNFLSAGADTVTKSVGDKAESITKWAEDYARFVAGDTETPAPVAKATTAKKSAEPVAIDHSTIADLVAKAVEPLAAKVEDVAGTVKKIADRRPTKKAADLSDSGDGNEGTQTKSAGSPNWMAEKQRKSLLGG